jgi:small subunit ribosomal protein S3
VIGIKTWIFKGEVLGGIEQVRAEKNAPAKKAK